MAGATIGKPLCRSHLLETNPPWSKTRNTRCTDWSRTSSARWSSISTTLFRRRSSPAGRCVRSYDRILDRRPEDPDALRGYFEALESGLARYGRGEPRAVPEGAEPVVGFDLTTHENHFMGAGHNAQLSMLHQLALQIA